MQDLNFRRKRRRSSDRPAKKGRKPSSGTRKLKFDDGRRKLHFEKRVRPGKGAVRAAVGWGIQIILVCAAAFLLVFLFGYRVSNAGDSMSPALSNGDVVLVNRLIYNFKSPSRGDIIVFRQSGNTHYSIKRVAGLPGETVQIVDGSICINGEPLTDRIYVSDIEYAGVASEPIELGKDEFFVIGDNDTSSDDSRIADIGNVQRDEIFGEAWFVADSEDNFGFID